MVTQPLVHIQECAKMRSPPSERRLACVLYDKQNTRRILQCFRMKKTEKRHFSFLLCSFFFFFSCLVWVVVPQPRHVLDRVHERLRVGLGLLVFVRRVPRLHTGGSALPRATAPADPSAAAFLLLLLSPSRAHAAVGSRSDAVDPLLVWNWAPLKSSHEGGVGGSLLCLTPQGASHTRSTHVYRSTARHFASSVTSTSMQPLCSCCTLYHKGFLSPLKLQARKYR